MKEWLKKLAIITFELAVITGGLWFLNQKKGIHDSSQLIAEIKRLITQAEQEVTKDAFPESQQPVEKKYSWKFRGKEYSISETLYQNIYEFYKTQPKSYSYSGDLPENWEEQYYAMFLERDENDQTIKNLSDEIVGLGKQYNLSQDQIVELTLAFVQSIPYDDAKATEILAGDPNAKMNYPYEVLFENKGVCSDKSILAVSILRELGYGAALFVYEKENHMAIGIQCPKDYSTYSSGYCYAETTSEGNRIGIIPNIDSASNKTVDQKEVAYFNEAQSQQQQLKELGQVKIFQATQGNEYRGIISTVTINKEIDSLRVQLRNLSVQLEKMKTDIADEESSLKQMQNRIESYNKKGDVENYNKIIDKYNALAEKYKKDIKRYNNSVSLYNQTVERYNLLIKR